MVIFGYTEKFAILSSSQNFYFGLTMTPEVGMRLRSVTVYLNEVNSKTPNVKCFLYTNTPNPCHKLAESESWQVTLGWDGWVTFNFPTNPILSAGITYQFFFWVGGYLQEVGFYYNALTSGSRRSSGQWQTEAPEPAGLNVSVDNRKISMYATCYIPPIEGIFDFIINEIDLSDECIISAHYIKSHPNPDPDTFEIRLLPECGEKVNFFDTVEIKKRGVTEYYGFVEEITPEVGEDGLEYLISGRCWKLMVWKKWNERFQESREVGPVDSEGNIETGFFGSVKPEELVKFIMRCPMSEHPKDKIRHKIGWGIASDYWDCCANVTADCFYPEWVSLRYTGLAWRGRGETDNVFNYILNVNSFVNEIDQWTRVGASPYLDAEDTNYIHKGTDSSNAIEKHFGFADLPANVETVTESWLYIRWFAEGAVALLDVYLYDGITYHYLGQYAATGASAGFPYPRITRRINVTSILDTVTKVNSARVYFQKANNLYVGIDHVYLSVNGSLYGDPANQRTDDWFIVDMTKPYDDVTAMLIECRNIPTMYARHYKIQYANLSNCCNTDNPPREDEWNDFTPTINVTDNEARDILHSWEPEDDVRCIRVKLTMSDCNSWEISQIYIWQADQYKYRLMDEGD